MGGGGDAAAGGGAAAGGSSMLWPLMAISALSQIQKSSDDSAQRARDYHLKAIETQFSPWSKMNPNDVQISHAENPFTAAMGGAVQGAGAAQMLQPQKSPWDAIAAQMMMKNMSDKQKESE